MCVSLDSGTNAAFSLSLSFSPPFFFFLHFHFPELSKLTHTPNNRHYGEQHKHTMKVINTATTLAIPEGLKVEIRNRVVTVEGPRGKLSRDFTHSQLNLKVEDGEVC